MTAFGWLLLRINYGNGTMPKPDIKKKAGTVVAAQNAHYLRYN